MEIIGVTLVYKIILVSSLQSYNNIIWILFCVFTTQSQVSSQGPGFFSFSLFSPEDTFSLLLERGEGRERNIDVREKHWSVASHMRSDRGLYTPNWGPNPQHRYVLWLAVEPAAFGYGSASQPTEPYQPGRGPVLKSPGCKRSPSYR